MSPIEFRELLTEIKAEIPEIKTIIPVINDSQLVNSLEKIRKEQNLILVGVLPSHGTTGSNTDNVKPTTVGQIIILEKCDYSSMTQDEFWLVFERCYQAVTGVREILIRKAMEDCLPYLTGLDVNSLNIDPEWKKGECNGYSFAFDIM